LSELQSYRKQNEGKEKKKEVKGRSSKGGKKEQRKRGGTSHWLLLRYFSIPPPWRWDNTLDKKKRKREGSSFSSGYVPGTHTLMNISNAFNLVWERKGGGHGISFKEGEGEESILILCRPTNETGEKGDRRTGYVKGRRRSSILTPFFFLEPSGRGKRKGCANEKGGEKGEFASLNHQILFHSLAKRRGGRKVKIKSMRRKKKKAPPLCSSHQFKSPRAPRRGGGGAWVEHPERGEKERGVT